MYYVYTYTMGVYKKMNCKKNTSQDMQSLIWVGNARMKSWCIFLTNITQHLSPWNMPWAALHALHLLTHPIITLNLGVRYYFHPHFTNKETEGQKASRACLRPRPEAKGRLKPRRRVSEPVFLTTTLHCLSMCAAHSSLKNSRLDGCRQTNRQVPWGYG